MRSPIPLAVAAAVALFTACADAPETALGPDEALMAQGGGSPSYRYADYAASEILSLDFKQSGLGSFQSVPYALTATLVLQDFVCINGGSNEPSGDPTQVEQVVATNEVFPVTNGQVTGHLEVAALVSCHANGHEPHWSTLMWKDISHTWGGGNPGPVPTDPVTLEFAALSDSQVWSCRNKDCE